MSPFLSVDGNSIKNYSHLVNKQPHKICMIAASETSDEIDKIFETILTMSDALITPVIPMTLD